MGAADEPHGNLVHDIFVPGRLCVIGEHSDWAAGYRNRNRSIPPGFTLVATTQEGLHARIAGRTDGRLVFKASGATAKSGHAVPCREQETNGTSRGACAAPDLNVPFAEEALRRVVDEKGFYMYVAGTALVVCSRFGLFAPSSVSSSVSSSSSATAITSSTTNGTAAGNPAPDLCGGLTIDNYLTTLPLKKGLSSSAAVCVLVVRALCAVFDLELSVQQVMELAHLGEAVAGSKCGRMDQCCALGTNHVAAMFFDGEDVQIYEVAPPECGIFLVVADLNGCKDTVEMLARLNECFPVAKGAREEKVHQYMSGNVARAWRAVAAIERGDARALGRVMATAQESFDECAIPICPSEFSSPLLHAVMADQRVKELTWGVKGVGAQGDGSVQLLARGREEQVELTGVLKEMGMTCVLPVTVIRSAEHAAGSGDNETGSGNNGSCGREETIPQDRRQGSVASPPPVMIHPRRVRSAVIVAAGLSTRMFPASAVVKKELFPIVDHDGVCKPVILAIMEGLVESGIERFVVVVQEKDIEVFDDFFSMRAVQKHKHRLKPPQRSYCASIESLRARVTYAVQEQQEGFGHAVYCARRALGVNDSDANGERVVAQSPTSFTSTSKAVANGNGHADCFEHEDDGVESSFLLVLGDHLYRRGAGTTRACASQLIHAFLEHGEAGKPAIGLKVMEESSVSPYGVAAGECVAVPPAHTVERWQRAGAPSGSVTKRDCGSTPPGESPGNVKDNQQSIAKRSLPLGGRVYRVSKLVEKPTAEFARENLVTPGLGPGAGGEGRHLVVFGQYILPTRRTFGMLAEDINADRRERGEFQLTSVLDRMRQEDDGMLGCIVHGEALDMGIPAPYVTTMGAFAEPHCA